MNLLTTPGFSIVLGALLGLGLYLMASPILWPRQEKVEEPTSLRSSRLAASLRDNAEILGMTQLIFVIVQVGLAILAVLATFAATGVLILCVVAAIAGAYVPWMLASRRRKARVAALRLVWPDVVDTLIAAIRSGATIPEAIVSLSTSPYSHVSGPAREFAVEYQASGNSDMALTRLKQRWGDSAGDRIVETLRLAREVGSSATTMVLSTLSSQLRADSALRQEIQARQSWVFVAARIGVIAPWLVLIMLSLRPEAAHAYNSRLGIVVVLVGALVSLIAYRLMLSIGALRPSTRWLS